MLVCLTGLMIGLLVATFVYHGVQESVMLAGLYLAGVLTGAVIGSILVTSRPPLLLLQVKE